MKFLARKLKHLLKQVSNSSLKEATWVVPRKQLTSLKRLECLPPRPARVIYSHPNLANWKNYGTVLEKLPIAAVLRFPGWKWLKIVNESPGHPRKSIKDLPRSWRALSILVSRLPLNTPRLPLDAILPLSLAPILAVTSALGYF